MSGDTIPGVVVDILEIDFVAVAECRRLGTMIYTIVDDGLLAE